MVRIHRYLSIQAEIFFFKLASKDTSFQQWSGSLCELHRSLFSAGLTLTFYRPAQGSPSKEGVGMKASTPYVPN